MQRKTVLISLAIVTILVLASLSTAIIVVKVNDNNGEKEVINQEMRVKGIESNGVDVYKNLPYAEAPSGDARFAPPVFKEANWTEIRDCTKWGNIPYQGHFYTSQETRSTYHGENESEDCLNLNIWTPAGAKAGDKYPVYVWIHGGGYVNGSGQDSCYDGTHFAQKGIIVVTIEYRLGALGFLCLDELKTKYGTTGNNGTLDQICALEWIQKYIEKFGGDKNKVTIGGESAGSFSVFNLVTSKLTQGKNLFQQAIMESGSIGRFVNSMRSYDDAKALSENLAVKYGAKSSSEYLSTLMSVPADQLMNDSDMCQYMSGDNSTCFWPVYDDVVLPADPIKAIENKQFNNVRMIIGYNSYEGLLFTDPNVTEEGVNHIIDTNYVGKENQDAVKAYYKEKRDKEGWSIYDCAAELTGTTMFKMTGSKVQELFTKAGAVVYGYEFLHQSDNGTLNSIHSVEIAYAFGQTSVYGIEMNAKDLAIMNQMHGHWVNFIKTGNPNGIGVAHWDQYNCDNDRVMDYGKFIATMMPKWEAETFETLGQWYFTDPFPVPKA